MTQRPGQRAAQFLPAREQFRSQGPCEHSSVLEAGASVSQKAVRSEISRSSSGEWVSTRYLVGQDFLLLFNANCHQLLYLHSWLRADSLFREASLEWSLLDFPGVEDGPGSCQAPRVAAWRSRKLACLGPGNLGEERNEDRGHFHVEAGIPLMTFSMKYPSQRDPQPPRGRHQEDGGQSW